VILFILMMEGIRYSEASVLTRATQRHVPEDGILHSDYRENLKSYIALTGWVPDVMFPLRHELGFYIP
jgi:hypothetical protein